MPENGTIDFSASCPVNEEAYETPHFTKAFHSKALTLAILFSHHATRD